MKKPRLAQGRDQEGEESHEGSLFTSVYAAKEEAGSDMKRAPRLRGSFHGLVISVRLISDTDRPGDRFPGTRCPGVRFSLQGYYDREIREVRLGGNRIVRQVTGFVFCY